MSDAMEEEVVQSIANSIQHPEYLLEHPAEFARELLMAYVSQNSLTAILFSGSQANHFADSIERSIKQMIFEKYPELKEDTAMNVMLSYCIQGSYHAYQKNRSGDIMTVIDVIAGMTGAIRSMYEERLGESRS
ncbi:MAG: TetR/AcrR family transcriptional regulator [Dorea sp.]